MTNIWIFATWSENWGWSGAKLLLEKIKNWEIGENINVETLVTNHSNWWVAEIYNEYSSIIWDILKKIDFPKREEDWNFSEENIEKIKIFYQDILIKNNLDFIFLSGWLKQVLWLPTEKVINIHPGPMSSQGYWWKWMFWLNIHKKVFDDYREWKIKKSCVTMHYVNDEIDKWPIIIQAPVELKWCTSPDDVQKNVNKVEHEVQWKITKLISSWAIVYSKWWILINSQNEIDKLQFPEWSLFWKTIDLV